MTYSSFEDVVRSMHQHGATREDIKAQVDAVCDRIHNEVARATYAPGTFDAAGRYVRAGRAY